jgi:selenocysteine lyase/cysteine desulfurase
MVSHTVVDAGGDRLARLVSNERRRRQAFPTVRKWTYLAHAAVSPLPRATQAALTHYVRAAAANGQFEHLHRDAESSCRRLLADLLSASPDEIAFVPSTSAGIGMVAAGLDWHPGDRVLVADGDFPSNYYPWYALRRLGVELTSIPPRETGEIRLEDIQTHLSPRIRLVALSSAHYVTGVGIDVEAIAGYLRSRDVLFCLDAIQSLGATSWNANAVDFVVADAHKWLLGPQGIGVLRIRRDRQRDLRPVLTGWKSVTADGYAPSGHLKESAQRYEPGSLNALGLVGLSASLRLLTDVGMEHVANRVRTLRGILVEELQAQGCRPLAEGTAPTSPGTVAFVVDGLPARDVAAWLRCKGFVVSVRRAPEGRDCIRVSPHFYNTPAELGRLGRALAGMPRFT